MKVYVTAFVPAEYRAAAEQMLAPFLTGAGDCFTVPLVPLVGADDAVPTAFGSCAGGIDSEGSFIQAVPGLVAMVPGAQYAIASPWRDFDRQEHWVDWLAGLGLKERRELQPAE
jgi:hypothetical protein